MPKRLNILRIVVAIALLLCLRERSPAQRFVRGPVAIAVAEAGPDSQTGDASEGVYVRDSVKALDNFTLGQRMERLKEWNKAADAYQEIVEKCADQVVQSKVDSNNKVTQYKSVTVAVQERLAHWPQEGLRAYKARFEPMAQAILEQAGHDD